jgi:hypothetical protein
MCESDGNITVFADFLVNWHENGKVAEVKSVNQFLGNRFALGDAIMVGYHADCPF